MQNVTNHDRANAYAYKVESKAAKTGALNEAVRAYLSLRRAHKGRLGGEGDITAEMVANAGATCIREARKVFPGAMIGSTLRNDCPETGLTHASGPGWEVCETRNREVHLFIY